MPLVEFASSIRKHLDIAARSVPAETVGEALEHVFAAHPGVRGYVLDDQGQVRKHVVVFLNDQAIVDRKTLGDHVEDIDRIFVFQALSGG